MSNREKAERLARLAIHAGTGTWEPQVAAIEAALKEAAETACVDCHDIESHNAALAMAHAAGLEAAADVCTPEVEDWCDCKSLVRALLAPEKSNE